MTGLTTAQKKFTLVLLLFSPNSLERVFVYNFLILNKGGISVISKERGGGSSP